MTTFGATTGPQPYGPAQPATPATVSIVVLSALRQELTRRCLDSIFAFTPQPFEIVVVDMGLSAEVTDWLGRVEKERRELRVVWNPANVGTTRGRNQGIEASDGDFVVFMDNDVSATPGWLTPLLAGLQRHERVGACGAKVVSSAGRVLIAPPSLVSREEDGRVVAVGLRLEEAYDSDDPRVDAAANVPWYPTTCLAVRRDVLLKVGGFDESLFMVEEDKDLCLRIRSLGLQILYEPASRVVHAAQHQDPDYRRIRDDAGVIEKDIAFFQAKWGVRVVLECRRSYLKHLGLSDLAIRLKARLDPFTTVIDG